LAAKERKSKGPETTKFIIIILAGIAFTFFGLAVLASNAFYVPFVVTPVVILVVLSRRRKGWGSQPVA
jgi:hypothetical protein